MLKEVEQCKKIAATKFDKPLAMTDEDEANFAKTTKCHISDNTYTKKDTRIRDDCHVTGNYRGSAHQDCNLKLRINTKELKIPDIFHNLRGYDSHFIMQEIGTIALKYTFFNKRGEEQQMDMAFVLGKHLVFPDSFQFMSSSLENLTDNLLRCF